MRTLLLATNNPGKAREFRRILSPFGIRCLTAGDLGLKIEVAEDGCTYADNAGRKARAFAEAGRMPALADDSGIEVDALGGQPGVRSARFGGPGLTPEERNARLLKHLEGVPPPRRTARYRAVVAVAEPGSPEVHTFEGVLEGAIALTPRGRGGFGYDPIFLVDGEHTAAELADEKKDRISHRGQACRRAAEFLRTWL